LGCGALFRLSVTTKQLMSVFRNHYYRPESQSRALSCYEKYDCTGQELINRSIVLINGEGVTLDLQKAEAEFTASSR
jgi:hypothetical protein